MIASNINMDINFQRIRSRVYSWCTVSIGGIEQRIICDARHARIAGVHDQRSHFRCGNLTPDISGVKIPSHAFKQKRYYSNSCVCLLSIVLSIVADSVPHLFCSINNFVRTMHLQTGWTIRFNWIRVKRRLYIFYPIEFHFLSSIL